MNYLSLFTGITTRLLNGMKRATLRAIAMNMIDNACPDNLVEQLNASSHYNTKTNTTTRWIRWVLSRTTAVFICLALAHRISTNGLLYAVFMYDTHVQLIA
jgi:hypothetical protein